MPLWTSIVQCWIATGSAPWPARYGLLDAPGGAVWLARWSFLASAIAANERKQLARKTGQLTPGDRTYYDDHDDGAF